MHTQKETNQHDEPEDISGSSHHKTHIDALDGIRAMACFMVVVGHATQAGFFPDTFRYNLFLVGIDKLGVMLFFTLSGFLISFLYLSKECSKKNLWQYVVSRFSRIYPLFIFVIFLHWLYFYIGFEPPSSEISFVQMTTADFWKHLFLLKGDGVFWTVSTEFRFYAFFVFIWVIYATFLKKPAILHSLLFAGFILLSMMKYDTQQIHLLFSLHFFLAGTIAGDLYARYHESLKNALSGYEFFIFFPLFFLSFPNVYEYVFSGQQAPRFQDGMNAIIYACLVLYAATGKKAIQLILGNPLTRWLGAISFSVYLLHRPLLAFFKAFIDAHELSPNILLFFVYLIITIAIGATSYYAIEITSRKGLKKLLLRNATYK